MIYRELTDDEKTKLQITLEDFVYCKDGDCKIDIQSFDELYYINKVFTNLIEEITHKMAQEEY